MNKRITEEQARLSYERTVKLEQEFGEYFTGTKQGQISCWTNIKEFQTSFLPLFEELIL